MAEAYRALADDTVRALSATIISQGQAAAEGGSKASSAAGAAAAVAGWLKDLAAPSSQGGVCDKAVQCAWLCFGVPYHPSLLLLPEASCLVVPVALWCGLGTHPCLPRPSHRHPHVHIHTDLERSEQGHALLALGLLRARALCALRLHHQQLLSQVFIYLHMCVFCGPMTMMTNANR